MNTQNCDNSASRLPRNRRPTLQHRAALRCVALGILALTLGTQCRGVFVDFCTSDALCDDSDACTADHCDLDSGLCSSESPCDADHCINSVCVECLADTECANTDRCDGAETCSRNACVPGTPLDCDDDDPCTDDRCDTQTGCVSVEVICGPDEPCVDGYCALPCDADADCNDADPCTIEACVDGVCTGQAADCDDGVACTDDTCDPATGCSHLDNCTGDATCDAFADACVFIDPCAGDADCPDDGLFCTGVESCSEDGYCVSSGNPCNTAACLEPGEPCSGSMCEICYEDLDECMGPMPGGFGWDFTLSADSISGTVCNDSFTANLAFNAPTGTNRPTLQTGDSADAREGEDTLFSVFNFTTATTVTPTLRNIETITITDFGSAATTLDARNITGTQEFGFLNGSNSAPFVLSNLAQLADLRFTNQGGGANAQFTSAATTGATDAITVTLDRVSGATITLVTDPINGIEFVELVSSGTPNTLAVFAIDGAAPAVLTVSGTDSLTLQGPASARTINAVDLAGSLTMSATSTVAVAIVGGGRSDTLYGSASADDISAGAGDDLIVGQGGADSVLTGSGADHVAMVLADAGDVIADFAPGTDKFDYNTALSSIDANVTTPVASGALQSAAAGTAISGTTTVFELTGSALAAQSAANLVSALGATAANADTNASILFVVYTAGGGGAIWHWVNADADVEASELTLVATFSTLTADSLSAIDFE